MSSAFSCSLAIYVSFILLAMAKGNLGTTFTIVNRCDYTVWPGILSNAAASATGFQLPPTATISIAAQPGWSGRFWGRTGCSSNPTTGEFICATGDCGSNQIECGGAGAKPPATLAEFTIGAAQDFYDVSLVDGYNLPVAIEPVGGSGACGSTGCAADLNWMCPSELRAGDGQACKSACEAFGSAEYCCSGAYGAPETCRPSIYSEMFKSACPSAYSYAYDDATSTFTCNGADYTITFCPSHKSSDDSLSPVNGGTTSALPPPATAADTTDGGGGGASSQAQDIPPAWLPNFVIGGSPHFAVNAGATVCAVTILFSIIGYN